MQEPLSPDTLRTLRTCADDYAEAKNPGSSSSSKLKHAGFVSLEATEASAAGVFESTWLAMMFGLASESLNFLLIASGGISFVAAIVEAAKWSSRRAILKDLNEKREALYLAISAVERQVNNTANDSLPAQEKLFSEIAKAIIADSSDNTIKVPQDFTGSVKDLNILLLTRWKEQCLETKERVKWDGQRLNIEVGIGGIHGAVGLALLILAILDICSLGAGTGTVLTIFLVVAIINYTATFLFACQKLWDARQELKSAEKHRDDLREEIFGSLGRDDSEHVLLTQANSQVEKCKARYNLRKIKLLRVFLQLVSVTLIGVGAGVDWFGSATDTVIAVGSISNIIVALFWSGYQVNRVRVKKKKAKASSESEDHASFFKSEDQASSASRDSVTEDDDKNKTLALLEGCAFR
ncbi:MAG: hypothetical protein V3V61_04255 [Gammaproteobacteria bacterium]